ncbi:MAG: hypothetical protein SCH71_16410 [Desulfobulbaceae bacterium]|nr:hypothetical protein [Desulfobulbaceae bacterium]
MAAGLSPRPEKKNTARTVGFVVFLALAVLLTFGAHIVPAGGRRPLPTLEAHYRASVLRGWRLFQTSFARDGVACVHCHLDHESMGPWAPAYPKVEVFDGTPYEVKTLDQVVTEALSKHTDLHLRPDRAMIGDLVSYISWWGDGLEIRPGHSRSLPPPSSDLEALAQAVERGRRYFESGGQPSCSGCHPVEHPQKESLGLTRFPRYFPQRDQVLSLARFLTLHLTEKEQTEPSARLVTDLAAYLSGRAAGQVYLPGSPEEEDHAENE